jgi:hypothetical protein
MTACDSCGRPADPQHVRERIERLELATRHRPVHIRALLIDAAPPAAPNDYFYRAAKDRSERSEAARIYFEELLGSADVAIDSTRDEESALAEFQRAGLFLAYAVECPVDNSVELAGTVRRNAATMLKRIQLSYKPKFIAVLPGAATELVPTLQAAKWIEQLILPGGSQTPAGQPVATSSSEPGFGVRLSDALKGLA